MKIKNFKKETFYLLAAAVLSALTPQKATAEEVAKEFSKPKTTYSVTLDEKVKERINNKKPEIEVGMSMTYASGYFFRGVLLVNDPVIQLSAYISSDLGPFTINGSFWGGHSSKTGEFTEMDYTLSVSTHLSRFNLTAGYAYISLLGIGDYTQEVFFEAALEKLFKITLVHDFVRGGGNYLEFLTNHYFDLGKIGISAKAAISHNWNYFREDSSFSHTEIRLGVPIPISSQLTITPNINYSKSLNKDFQDVLYGGVSLEFNF